jgi:glycosyltransferase involved in cell wall biosynthesis
VDGIRNFNLNGSLNGSLARGAPGPDMLGLSTARPSTNGNGSSPSVAIVHDYLNQRGGAERVVLELARMWPQAPIYTSLYRELSTYPAFAERDIITSPLDRIRIDGGFRGLAPLYPAAFRSFGTLDQDLVISSSSGWAHGVRTAAHSRHVVYCHTPARWLYNGRDYLPSRARRAALAPMIKTLRGWDRRVARRADVYIANSENVRRRIYATYGIDAEVIHPPVETERFVPSPRGERLLVVSRLLGYKRVRAVVEAVSRSGLALDVVGTGPALTDLRAIAGPSVTFHGHANDHDVGELMQSCRALVVAGTEDFGIASVEAQAAGKPVVAFAAGGALETIEDGVTGALFHDHDPEAVSEAFRRAEALTTSPEDIARHAHRFSRAAFRDRLLNAITRMGSEQVVARNGDRSDGELPEIPALGRRPSR